MYMVWFDSFGESRRRFVQTAAAALGSALSVEAANTGENVFGPKPGYSPQIGTLVRRWSGCATPSSAP
jgi:hypothetical protein